VSIRENDLHLDVAGSLARARKQDQDAARALVEFLYLTVIRIVRNNLPRRAAEEDLAQDVFLKMFEKLDQFQGEVPLEHWVSRIAVNHWIIYEHKGEDFRLKIKKTLKIDLPSNTVQKMQQ
jgi:DNA-directed RNA polymerase specialized sigma24 family protein